MEWGMGNTVEGVVVVPLVATAVEEETDIWKGIIAIYQVAII